MCTGTRKERTRVGAPAPPRPAGADRDLKIEIHLFPLVPFPSRFPGSPLESSHDGIGRCWRDLGGEGFVRVGASEAPSPSPSGCCDSESFRVRSVRSSNSETFRVTSSQEFFRVLPSTSESFRVLPSPSESLRVLVRALSDPCESRRS
jgi:hypothetical protein